MIPAALRLIRPQQWTKNAFCLAGLFFSGRFLDSGAILNAAIVFATFCAASSVVYVGNDLKDVERDRAHPRKRLRPLPSGAVSKGAATIIMVLLLAAVVFGALATNARTGACLGLYLAINAVYTLSWKHEPILDVTCIASGFVLRLLAGVFAIGELPTTWITLCTLFLALFLGFAKRRAELAAQHNGGDSTQRPVLRRYSILLLDSLLNSTATMAVMSYALFTVLSNKDSTLVATVPFVVYGVMHYKFVVMAGDSAEEPDRMLLNDRRLQLCIAGWLVVYLAVVMLKPGLFR